MSFVDKLKFWKHKDPLDFDDFATSQLQEEPFQHSSRPVQDPFVQDNLGIPQSTSNSPSSSYADPFSRTDRNSLPNGISAQAESREHELINSKLDTIKAVLQSLDQRIANIERIAAAEQQQTRQEQPGHKLW